MAAELQEAGMVALNIAVGCREILQPVLHFLEGNPARGPALDAAVLLLGFAVVLAFLAGVVLIYINLSPAAGTQVVRRAAFRQYVLFLCALLALLTGAFHFYFLAAGGW